MKRIWLGMILCVALLSMGGARAEGDWQRNAVTSDGSQAWLLAGRALWTLDEQFDRQEQAYEFEADVRDICAHGGTVYAAVRTAEGISFSALSDGALSEIFLVPGEADVYDFAVTDECVAVLWERTPEDEQTLPFGAHRLSAYDWEGRELPMDVPAATALSGCGRSKLLLAESEAYSDTIVCLDTATGERQTLLTDAYVKALSGTEEEVYFLEDNGLNRIEDGRASNVYMAIFDEPAELAQCGSSLAAVLRETQGDRDPLLFTWSPDRKATVLTMINVDQGLRDARMDAALAQLRREYPDVEVRFEEMLPDQLNTALMARDDSLDIMQVSRVDSEAVISAGALVDLNSDPVIVEELKHWNNVEPLMTYDGKLYGVPSIIWADTLRSPEEVRDFLPEGFDPGACSWQRFFEQALAFDGDINGDGQQEVCFLADRLAYPLWHFQYVACYDRLEDVEYDTPLFRELAEGWRACVQAGQVMDILDAWNGKMPALYEWMVVTSPNECMADELYWRLPKLGDRDVQTAASKGFAVNVSSPHREIALWLLEIYASRAVQVQRNVYMLADPADYGQDFERRSESEKQRIRKDMEWYASLRPDLITQSYRSAGAGDWMERYLNGEVTTDELVQGLQATLRKVILG